MTEREKLRVLIVEDSAMYREVLYDVLRSAPNIEVVGHAVTGVEALEKVNTLRPDLMTLDVEMPHMTGIEVLWHLRNKKLDVGSIMVSNITDRGAKLTVMALAQGAFDFLRKPDLKSVAENREFLSLHLLPKIEAFALKKMRTGKRISAERAKAADFGKAVPEQDEKSLHEGGAGRLQASRKGGSEVIAIGTSTGGPIALQKVLSSLPADLPVPVLVVQHMPKLFTRHLANNLNETIALNVREAKNGEEVRSGCVYLAPGGSQMKVASVTTGAGAVIRITDDPPENNCKPSVDYLFRSVAYMYKDRATGVIMTGMGRDGTLGLKLMKRFGAGVIAQDEESSTIYGMPKNAVDAGVVDQVVPLDRIASEIMKSIKSKV